MYSGFGRGFSTASILQHSSAGMQGVVRKGVKGRRGEIQHRLGSVALEMVCGGVGEAQYPRSLQETHPGDVFKVAVVASIRCRPPARGQAIIIHSQDTLLAEGVEGQLSALVIVAI